MPEDAQTWAPIAISALVLGGLLALRVRPATPFSRLAWVLLPLALISTLIVAWAAFRLVPFWTWSAARLAASARLAYGFPLYTAPGDAMVNGWVYGPVSAIAYWPAIWAGEPLAALRAATWLNALYFLLPPFLVGAPLWSMPGRRLSAAYAAIFGVAALLVPYSTWYGAAALSADTVAICLGSCSCLALSRGRHFALAAALAVLAVWSKQIEAPLLLAQIGFLTWKRGGRVAAHYTGWLAGMGLLVSAAFGLWFGFAALWHCTVTIPSRHPLETARLGGLLLALAGSTWWVWPLALAARPWRRTQDPADGSAPNGAAFLLLLVSLALLPGGLAAAAKAGGDQNSLHTIAYAVLGAITLAAGWLGSSDVRHASRARLALLAGLALALFAGGQRIVVHDHLAVADPGAQHREAFAFARARPGQTSYPCNPLISLMAERRDYPFVYGLDDWRLAGAAPSPEALRRLLPPTLTFIVYHEKDPSHEMIRVFPNFNRRRVTGPWDMFTRAPAPPPPGDAAKATNPSPIRP